MNPSPRFAVVGHPNKGKSSVVATLSQNDRIAIALEPGTTRDHQEYPLTVDGRTLYTLIDTPGFQRPRRVLEWLQAHSHSAADRPETVSAFVTQHQNDPQFHDECELLTPIIAGAGIIYVVDGSVPYSRAHEAEMTILRWTGRPSLALINRIGPDDHTATWQAALGQYFQIVRQFNAVTARFDQHLSLLRAFGQLQPEWEQPLERASQYLQDERQHRRDESARLITEALISMVGWQELQTTATVPDDSDRLRIESKLKDQWYAHQRQSEQSLRRSIERLYGHHRIVVDGDVLEQSDKDDLFSQASRDYWGVSRQYLATAGFGAGALGGVGIDALTLGHSFGAGALIGGLIGAAGSYFYGDRLLPKLSIGPLDGSLQQIRFGPILDPQFGYVVLGRAINHWWRVSERNHAGRDPVTLGPAEDHWLERLTSADRSRLQRLFDLARRKREPDAKTRIQATAAVGSAMSAFGDWQSSSG